MRGDIASALVDGWSSSATGRAILSREWDGDLAAGPAEWPAALLGVIGPMLDCPVPMAVAWGADLSLLFNDAFCLLVGERAMGVSLPQLVGDGWDAIAPRIAATLSGGPPHRVAMPFGIRATAAAPAAFACSAIRDGQGGVGGLLVVADHRQDAADGDAPAPSRRAADLALAAAKAEREFIIALTAQQRALADPDAILAVSLRAVGERLGVDRAGFYRQRAGDTVSYVATWTSGRLAPLLGDRPAGRYGQRLRRCREQGEPLVFADAATDSVGGLDELIADGVAAGICIPIMRGDAFVAGVFVHAAEPRLWTASESALLREVAELVMLAVERAEALEQLESRVGQQEHALWQQASELRDQIAGRSAAEDQVRQLQKMDAVGQLTGGIAHDFNNMLAVIIGALNLMQRRIERGDTGIGRYIEAAMDGATRAAALTQRLLAFARQAPLAPKAVDLAALIRGLGELLDRTLGDDILLSMTTAADLRAARADPGQLENVIINLAVNARDAMPDGGRLAIDAANVTVGADHPIAGSLALGDYVRIAVSDSGLGMSPAVMARAFEPFFTTKAVGKGTGLGLAQVFGFARQSGGHVTVESQEGQGTTFCIYLPGVEGEQAAGPARASDDGLVRGSAAEVVLVVEDEERLRGFVVETLRDLGYSVIAAADAEAALAAIDGGARPHVLLSDIVMPGRSGIELAAAAAARVSGLRTVYMTGHVGHRRLQDGALDADAAVLLKPFGIGVLAAKLRELLETPTTDAAS